MEYVHRGSAPHAPLARQSPPRDMSATGGLAIVLQRPAIDSGCGCGCGCGSIVDKMRGFNLALLRVTNLRPVGGGRCARTAEGDGMSGSKLCGGLVVAVAVVLLAGAAAAQTQQVMTRSKVVI